MECGGAKNRCSVSLTQNRGKVGTNYATGSKMFWKRGAVAPAWAEQLCLIGDRRMVVDCHRTRRIRPKGNVKVQV